MDNIKLFYCYSIPLKIALEFNGFKCLGNGLHDKTGHKYYLFLGTDELNDYKKNKYPLEKDKFKQITNV